MLAVQRLYLAANSLALATVALMATGCGSGAKPPPAAPEAPSAQASAPPLPQPAANPSSPPLPPDAHRGVQSPTGASPPSAQDVTATTGAAIAATAGASSQESVVEPSPALAFPLPGRALNVAFAADGKSLAVATDNGSVYTCQVDPVSATERFQANPQGDLVALSGDGRLLLVGDLVRPRIDLWDVTRRGTLTNLGMPRGAIVAAVAMSPTNNAAAAVFADPDSGQSHVLLYNRLPDPAYVETGWKPGLVSAAEFSPDGQYLAVASTEGVRLMDVATGQPVGTFQMATKRADRLAYAFEGHLLAVACNDAMAAAGMRVLLVDPLTGAEQPALDNSRDAITTLAFSSDGKHLVIGDAAGSVDVWDVSSRTVAVRIRAPQPIKSRLAFAREGNRLLAIVEGVATLLDLDAVITRDPRIESPSFEFLPLE